MNNQLMKCGHSANATCDGKPACSSCLGIKRGADQIDKSPNLIGRKAICCYGNHGETESDGINYEN